MRFAGEIALVTGAAGGIGSFIAKRLGEEGARVIATDRSLPDVGDCAIACDLSEPEGRQKLVSETGQFAPPTLVIGAAATSIHASVLATDIEAWQRLHSINTLANVALLQAFAPAMQRAGRGAFVFISSINAAYATPGQGAYAATKAALDSVVQTAALELAGDGVRVNSVRPASVDTPLLRAGLASASDPEAALATNILRHPLGRIGTAEDVASVALFLASAEAAWITGQCWMVDGGASVTRR